MFGKNPIRSNETNLDGQTLAVQEVFYTIQGEGPFSGTPAVFVRLAGCNLACTFCDTEFESGITNRLDVDQIVKKTMSFPRPQLVVLTGGEPLRQNVVPLIKLLLMAGVHTVQIETAGTVWTDDMAALMVRTQAKHSMDHDAVVIVCSPKTPMINRDIQAWVSHYKYVIEAGKVDVEDGLPVSGTQTRNFHVTQRIFRPWMNENIANMMNQNPADISIWVSPCDHHDEGANRMNMAAAVASSMKHGYRLSLQTHKILGLP